MEDIAQAKKDVLKPPVTSVGVIGWAKANLFNGVFNSVLTILTLLVLWKTVPPFLKWAFLDSVWQTSGAACREATGACWSVIWSNLRFIIFGFFPHDQHWRPFLAMMILFGLLFYSQDRQHWTRYLGYGWIGGVCW